MFEFLTWAAVKTVAGKAVSNAWSDVRGVGRWIGGLDLAHFLLLALALFAATQTAGRWMQHRRAVKVEAQLTKCADARAADAGRYAAAQQQAAALNKADVTATESKWKKVTSDEKQGYLDDLAHLRADFQQRLRASAAAAAADRGAPGAAAPPGAAADPARADADGVQVHPPADVQAERDEDAAEIELRLFHLQNLVRGLAAAGPNAGAAK